MKISKRKKIFQKREVPMNTNINVKHVNPLGFNIIVFSKDRPCQLDLFLKSMSEFWNDDCLRYVSVLYTYSNDCYRQGYEIVRNNYPYINYNLESNFRSNLLFLLRKQNVRYTVFFTDDDVFINKFETGWTEFNIFTNSSEILCFSLRLGNNIVYDYCNDMKISMPDKSSKKAFMWTEAEGSWGYPMSIDGHIFKTDDIVPLIEKLNFSNPSTLEEELASNPIREKPQMICHDLNSVIMNYPANIVQNTYNNRCANTYSTKDLNDYFLRGFTIDSNSFYNVLPESPHQSVNIMFTTGVNVLMPLYNGVEFIDQSVNSVINQSHKNWELIIGINGYDQNPPFYQEIKNKFTDSRIKIINFSDTRGKSETLNEMIKICKNRWIAILDVDDYWDHDKLKKQIQQAVKYDIIGTRCKYFNKEKIFDVEPNLYFDKINYTVFNRTNPIINSSSLFMKDFAFWNKDFEGIEDYEMWLRLNYEKKTFFNINDYLTYHRLHENSFFNTRNFNEKIILAIEKWKIK